MCHHLHCLQNSNDASEKRKLEVGKTKENPNLFIKHQETSHQERRIYLTP
jgi:hypothetical protein